MWRILPALSAGLLVIAFASFSLYAVESDRGVAARSFGNDGQSWRVIVVTNSVSDDTRLSDALRRFCDEYETSVAFSSADSGVVTLYDPLGRFRSPGGSLYERLSEARSEPAALLSTALDDAPNDRVAVIPDGVELRGSFEPTVQFDGRYPAVLANLAAVPVHSGVFRFAGLTEGDEVALLGFFAGQNAEVVRLDVDDSVSLVEFWSTLLGRIVVLFVSLSLLAALFVMQGYASLFRPRLGVATFCGATPHDLRLLLLRRLVPSLVTGAVTGVTFTLVMVQLLRRAMLADLVAIAMALSAAVLTCLAALALNMTLILWRESRRVSRVFPR